MDDEAYAAAMLAILANPNPAGIDPDDPYGRADDGIDRFDGFGRDVWVASVALTHGDHGAELDVAFALAVPDDLAAEGMPSRGSVRVPVEVEWRELSGYREPSAYAPAVARKVESAAGRLVQRHRSRLSGIAPTVPARPGTHWPAFRTELTAHGSPVEVAPGRIELRSFAGALTILVTPEQWEHVVATHAGNDVDIYLAELLEPRQDDEHFVVFYDGDLTRSTREKLPPVRGHALSRKLAEFRAAHPNAEFGWAAHAPQRPGTNSGSVDEPTV
jgi:hypothetical protein